MLHIG
jgi:MFS family permease